MPVWRTLTLSFRERTCLYQMHRKGSLNAIFGLCCLGTMAWLLAAATGPASGKSSPHKAAAVTVVTVTAGKPTEFEFTLSKLSALPKGPITFKVRNAGRFFHDFKICTTPVSSAAANSCVGKATKFLKSGQSETLTVTLTKSGKYEYLSAIPGRAAFGMKGLIGIGVKLTPSASVAGPTKPSLTSPPPGQEAPAPDTAGATCPAGEMVVGNAADGSDICMAFPDG